MWRAIRPGADQSRRRIQHSRNAMYLRRLQRLFEGQRRQDRRNSLRQHCFARSRRPDHQDVVSARARDFQRTFGRHLPTHIFEVDRKVLHALEDLLRIEFHRHDAVSGIEQVDDLHHRLDRQHIDAADYGRFVCVRLRHDQVLHLFGPCRHRDRQRPTHRSHAPIERQLANQHVLRHVRLRQPAVCANDAERHREIESRSFLLQVGGGKINRDLARRNIVAAVLERRLHALSALLYGGIRETDGKELVIALCDSRDIDFHLDEVGIDPINGSAEGLVKHHW